MRERILIIDDEPEFRQTLQDILESQGYVVEQSTYLASSIGDGLSGRYDLVTLDLRMPGVDGAEVARLLLQNAPGTAVLVISGFLGQGVARSLERLGIRHTLAKPADLDELLKAVQDALAESNSDAPAPLQPLRHGPV